MADLVRLGLGFAAIGLVIAAALMTNDWAVCLLALAWLVAVGCCGAGRREPS